MLSLAAMFWLVFIGVTPSVLAIPPPTPVDLVGRAADAETVLLSNTTIPANFSPPGGVGVLPTDPPPEYVTMSDFDFQSINLALNQEFIELDLFHKGLEMFSADDFEEAGLNANDQFLIQFMADQEVSHAMLLTNMLGGEHLSPSSLSYV